MKNAKAVNKIVKWYNRNNDCKEENCERMKKSFLIHFSLIRTENIKIHWPVYTGLTHKKICRPLKQTIYNLP